MTHDKCDLRAEYQAFQTSPISGPVLACRILFVKGSNSVESTQPLSRYLTNKLINLQANGPPAVQTLNPLFPGSLVKGEVQVSPQP
jgi:hypothetical protein